VGCGMRCPKCRSQNDKVSTPARRAKGQRFTSASPVRRANRFTTYEEVERGVWWS
jgi:transcriptional regulator NrdR family protein